MLGTRIVRHAAALALVAVGTAGLAVADFKDLLGRVPGEANALVVVDIEKVMKSPLAQREGWAEKRVSNYAHKPLLVPPEATRLVAAALLNLSDMDPLWGVSVMDTLTDTPMTAIAKAEGGFSEKLGDLPAAWSPVNAYFIQLKPLVLGAVSPADRQFASRWARQKHTLGGAFVSIYLRTAAAAIDSGTEIVMALDLQDAASARRLRRRLEFAPFDALQGKNVDLAALADVIASMKGLTLKIDVAEDIKGQGEIEFERDASILAPFAKPLLLEALTRFGAYVEDLSQWQVTVNKNRLTFNGKLSTEGLQRILSIVQTPAPRVSAEAAPPAGQTPPAPGAKPPTPANPAAATQEYYKAVAGIIQRLQKEIGVGSKSASLANISTWLKRDARRINQLPILGVDPDLVTLAAQIAVRMGDASQLAATGQLQTLARTSAVATPVGNYENDSWDDTSGDAQARADRMNADAQRRSAALEEKAKALDAAAQIFAGVNSQLAQMRLALTQKYNVEF